MKVLVGCETSGVVRSAYREAGHDAVSCDLLPADDGSPHHIEGNVCEAIRSRKWDLIICFPPCTKICVSGNAHYGTGKPRNHERIAAIEWTMALWELAKSNAPMVCMENPVGTLPIKPTQYIQPYQFGHNESKKTGLWLHGLPPLQTTQFVAMPMCGYRDNQTPSGQNKLGPSPDRAKIRSRTYEGIGAAMAKQWPGVEVAGGTPPKN